MWILCYLGMLILFVLLERILCVSTKIADAGILLVSHQFVVILLVKLEVVLFHQL
jgi:hypothetical protein